MKRLLLIALIIACTSSTVEASQGEQLIAFKAFYAYADQHAGGAALEYGYHLSDLWRLGAEVGWTGGDPNESRPWFAIQTGIQLDAISWVPYLQLVTSVHLGEGVEQSLGSAFLLGVEIGADYRPTRKFSMGLWAAYHHALATDKARNMPSITASGIRISTYF